MGGEKKVTTAGRCPALGSPPRGRGKGAGEPLRLLDGGITPAWAGKRYKFYYMRIFRRDHPRVGGEKVAFFVFAPYVLGSPPRGRGKEIMVTLQDINARITPAWAGKSFACAVAIMA